MTMVTRNDNTHDTDRISHTHLDRSSASRNSISKPTSDEVILLLANTHENKRARQVSEWERVQPSNIRRFY
jgi:hypothetical protein